MVRCFRCNSVGTKNGVSSRKQRYLCSNPGCVNRNFYLDNQGLYYFPGRRYETYSFDGAQNLFLAEQKLFQEFLAVKEFKELMPANYEKMQGKIVSKKRIRKENLEIRLDALNHQMLKLRKKYRILKELHDTITSRLEKLKETKYNTIETIVSTP